MTKSILIADTSESTRGILKKILADRYPLIVVESPAQAPAILKEKRVPFLVLMGINESGAKKDNVFAAARKLDAGITLIALAEPDEEAEAIEAVRMGATGYLIKPLNPQEVLSIAGKNT